MTTTNIKLVEHICNTEPDDYYTLLYKILKKDCETFDISNFKNFYIVKRLPLYNIKIFKDEISLIENTVDSYSDNNDITNRLLNGLQEVQQGHKTEELLKKCTFRITKHNIMTCAHITHNMTHIIHALKNDIDVKDYDLILEFGGGYSGMAKLCNDMGYKNKYYIYDLPELKPIQSYYLNSTNVKHRIINDYEILKNMDFSNKKKKLFIATWSLSEVSFDLREKILKIINNFDSVIIVYQKNIWNRDNSIYFGENGIFRNEMQNINNWNVINIPYINWDGGNYYLIGNN